MKKFTADRLWLLLLLCSCFSCSQQHADPPNPPPPPAGFSLNTWQLNNQPAQSLYYGASVSPAIRLQFTAALNQSSVGSNISLKNRDGAAVSYITTFQNNDSTVVLQPSQPLQYLTAYTVTVSTGLKATSGGALSMAASFSFHTGIDSSNKFDVLTDDALLDVVQRQTFKYFWEFGHPVSGLARERNTSGDVVTSGGSGFGVMAMLVAVQRNFISRADGLARVQKIVTFLKAHAQTFHGALPHWLNGSTGAVVPFSAKDDGADLVETSYLMQGLLCARQYFNGAGSDESTLRGDINSLWQAVEWSWFRKNGENVLYWHWSPNFDWQMNMPVRGWNEALITYVLAAASPKYGIPKVAYDEGWAQNGALKNGNTYFAVTLPLGPAQGGPLFFEHYSFPGINPANLKDAYADYSQQTTAHTQINYNYCVANPKNFWGYSAQCWGLTASDDINGYLAHEPTTDDGVISPTAALASLPYTPQQSLQALKFFYYTLGDKLWGEYGFIDAFSLHHLWFADSYLAIDQGPIIIMIENYRSGLLWNLFMACPEVKSGMKSLGFTSPNL